MDLFLYLTCLLALLKVRMYYVQKVSKLNNISRLLTLKYREFHIWMNRLTFPMSCSSQVLKRHKINVGLGVLNTLSVLALIVNGQSDSE